MLLAGDGGSSGTNIGSKSSSFMTLTEEMTREKRAAARSRASNYTSTSKPPSEPKVLTLSEEMTKEKRAAARSRISTNTTTSKLSGKTEPLTLSEEMTREKREARSRAGRPTSVSQGDTLWEIAQRRLGDGNRWPELRKADGSRFTDKESKGLSVGTQVYLPRGTTPGKIQPVNPVTQARRDAEKAAKIAARDSQIARNANRERNRYVAGEFREIAAQSLQTADRLNKKYLAVAARENADKAVKAARNASGDRNRGASKEFDQIARESRKTATQAQTTYFQSMGLDSSGKPITIKPPASPKPKPKEPEKSWWEKGWDKVKSGTTFVRDRAIDWVKDNTEVNGPTIDSQSVEERDRQLRQNLRRFWRTPPGDVISKPPVIEGPWTKTPQYDREQKQIQNGYTEILSQRLRNVPPYQKLQGPSAKARIPWPFSGLLPGSTDLSFTAGSYEHGVSVTEGKTTAAARNFSAFEVGVKKDLIASGNDVEIGWSPAKGSGGYGGELRHGEDTDGDGRKEYGMKVGGLPFGFSAGFRAEPASIRDTASNVKDSAKDIWNSWIG
jgi:hypothetical protein